MRISGEHKYTPITVDIFQGITAKDWRVRVVALNAFIERFKLDVMLE